jgi:hypothetical protein
MMTWGEFKQKLEREGVKDEMVLDAIAPVNIGHKVEDLAVQVWVWRTPNRKPSFSVLAPR